MAFFNRVLRRKTSHEDWLAAHPGKNVTYEAQAAVSTDEQARMRAQMEQEMEADRDKRGK